MKKDYYQQFFKVVSKFSIYGFLGFLVTVNFVFASSSNAQYRSVKEVYLELGFVDVPLHEVFREIESVTDYRFTFHENDEFLGEKISLRKQKMTVESLLLKISREKKLRFQQVNNNIGVRELATNDTNRVQISIDQQTISGKVTDENGEPLPGATILEKGTTNGTTADLEGQFKLNCSDDAVLTVSFVGYESQEVFVNSRSVVDVQLSLDAAQLEEVVVVGYGTQKKSDITGAISSVKGDDLESTPANTFVQSLQGRAAGVNIKAASNAPGGGIRIRIRGSSSINASSEPLYVIDGFPIQNLDATPQGAGNNALSPSPLSSLSPNEIESIEILKDASATAIYGSRGANGVILITTKRGQAGKPKINFEYSLNVASVRKKLDLANAEEIAILTNEWATNNGMDPIYDGVNKPLPEELGEGTDWQDAIFRTAPAHTYNLSISGGTDNTKYLIAGDYFDQDGIIIESNFKRAGLRFNLDQKVSNRIKMGINMNTNHTINDAVPSDGGGYQNDTPLWNALTTTPVIPVRNENGNYVHNHDEAFKILENPVSIAETRTDITKTNRILSSVFADIEIRKGLTFRANFGADLIDSKRNVYTPNTAETQALPNVGVASIGVVQSLNWLSEYTLTFNKDFGTSHRLTAMAGYTVQASEIESVFSRTDNFSSNKFEFNNLEAGSDPRPSQSQNTQAGLLSYIGRINYTYNDKYMLTGTIRRDGSSKFGADNKWGVFPSVGLAWRLSEEQLFRGADFLNDLKLRGSYGITGNQDIGSYSSLALYNTSRPIIGESPVIGFYPNRIPNPDLKWEKTAQYNFGLDMAFWNGKFDFSAEYYVKTTSDLLLNVTIPNQSGYNSSIQNIGKVENKGVELTLGYNNSFGDLKWNASFNISFNRNKVLALPEGTERLLFTIGRGETTYGRSIVIPGQPLGSFYGYHFEGLWQTEEEITEAGNVVGGKNRPGLPRYEDLNGDGFRDNDDDRKIVGNPNPDFIYGFSNEFTYKSLKLYVFINGSYGNEIANLNRIGLLTQPQKHNVLKAYYKERWTGPGTGNTIEAPLHNAGEWKNFSDRDVEDGSYLRVKTIRLSYNLPKAMIKGDWLRNVQVYVAGENLFTFTQYTGFDPEVDLYSSSNVQVGVDNGAYPVSKSVRVGVKLGF